MPDMSVCGQFDHVHLFSVCVLLSDILQLLKFFVLALFFIPLLLIPVYYNIITFHCTFITIYIPLSTLLVDHIVELGEREVRESRLTVDQLHQLTEEQ